jgi:hypothetical protein
MFILCIRRIFIGGEKMSFFTNFQSDRCPGPISGNPINGLCEKACIQVKRVFDACIKQVTQENVYVTVFNQVPPNPAYPLTFISAKSTSPKGIITCLDVDRLSDRPQFARVKADINIPIEVLYSDANGTEGKGDAVLSVSQDVILYVPQPSIIPFEVECVASAICPEGVYSGQNNFSVTACITVILKIVVEVELLVPTYGYCKIPPCQQFDQEICASYFELPIYPDGCSPNT